MFKKFLHHDLSYPRPEIFPGPPPAADYSILLLAVPAFSTLFLWVWGYMHLSQNTGMELSIIAVSMIATTASITAITPTASESSCTANAPPVATAIRRFSLKMRPRTMPRSGLRLLELLRLRVKDVDFEQHPMMVRDPK